MASLIYSSPRLYHCVMRILHGRHFRHRYESIAAGVPAGASVVEICTGDAWLYRHYLRQREIRYLGLDNAPAFVRAANAAGVPFRSFDVTQEPIPRADIIILHASLHLFSATAPDLIRSMLQAAGSRVIIAEPVRNMADSANPLTAWMGRRLTAPHGSGTSHNHRYREDSFTSLIRSFPECIRLFTEPGGREMIAVLRGHGTQDDS